MTMTGVCERRADWVRIAGRRVLCQLHLPNGQPVAGAVVCPALYVEAGQACRAEVLLCDALAELGVAAVRMEYRGCGNSEGDPAALTLASAREDCLAARGLLRDVGAGNAIGLAGVRWGALVAAAAAPAAGARALALWDATPDGESYFGELLEIRRWEDIWSGQRHPAGHHRRQLTAGHPVDVRSWRIHPSVVDSCADVSLARALAGRELAVRLVHTAGRRENGERLRAELDAAGCAVEHAQLDERALWWWRRNPLIDETAPPLVLEADAPVTAGWLARRLTNDAR